MKNLCVGLAMLATASAASADTDFGIRVLGGGPLSPPTTVTLSLGRPALGAFSLASAASLGAHWGRVTSTYRSPAHNRAVGGVANSWHMSGRAIDIARRAGVSHAQIAAAFRSAGYRLIESLDEGDHSHFAFASGASSRPAPAALMQAVAQSGSQSTAQSAAAAPSRFMARVPLVAEPRPEPRPAEFRVVASLGAHSR